MQLDDTIIKTIETAPNQELKESRDLILRIRSRNLYQVLKLVGYTFVLQINLECKEAVNIWISSCNLEMSKFYKVNKPVFCNFTLVYFEVYHVILFSLTVLQ